ncbi:8750_t:CDS:2 [Gigaspora margarita]|uniref:8750_t:CDS:1 n=1 Tax=Gigaspora margarita TaxID=4874 RepID=A0ABN7URG4_GIGMA|nr:8750_t:CDS:2 [Gigaspora margarita]
MNVNINIYMNINIKIHINVGINIHMNVGINIGINIDTNNVCDTDDQTTQRADSIDLDDLPTSTQNVKKLKLPKIPQGTSIPKQVTAPCKDPQESLQKPDLAQVNEHTNEQNKDVVMDRSNTLEQERQALLVDESIFFDFEVTELGPPNSEDSMTPITGKTQTNINMTTESSMDWPDIVRTRVANKSIDLREEELDATKWNYDTILQAFSNIKEPEATKTKRAKLQLPKDKETLPEDIKIIDEAPQIPIAKYNIINSTLE